MLASGRLTSRHIILSGLVLCLLLTLYYLSDKHGRPSWRPAEELPIGPDVIVGSGDLKSSLIVPTPSEAPAASSPAPVPPKPTRPKTNWNERAERVKEAFAMSKKLFALPDEDKMKAPHPKSMFPHRGYSRPGREKAYSIAALDKGLHLPIFH